MCQRHSGENASPSAALDADDDEQARCRAFHKAMIEVYQQAKDETGYNATYFIRMVSEQGGLRAARQLLSGAKPSDGFTALWERRRLDLSVEATALRDDFASLFTENELEVARTRLTQYGYHVRPE